MRQARQTARCEPIRSAADPWVKAGSGCEWARRSRSPSTLSVRGGEEDQRQDGPGEEADDQQWAVDVGHRHADDAWRPSTAALADVGEMHDSTRATDISHAPRRRRRWRSAPGGHMDLLLMLPQARVVDDRADQERPVAAGQQTEADQAPTQNAVQIIVVRVGAEEHEDAPQDQCHGHQDEPDGLARDLPKRHAASIPAALTPLRYRVAARLRDRGYDARQARIV